MQTLFSININKSEFSVVGIADVSKGTVMFQGMINGIPFTESRDYNKVRARVFGAVSINNPGKNDKLS